MCTEKCVAEPWTHDFSCLENFPFFSFSSSFSFQGDAGHSRLLTLGGWDRERYNRIFASITVMQASWTRVACGAPRQFIYLSGVTLRWNPPLTPSRCHHLHSNWSSSQRAQTELCNAVRFWGGITNFRITDFFFLFLSKLWTRRIRFLYLSIRGRQLSLHHCLARLLRGAPVARLRRPDNLIIFSASPPAVSGACRTQGQCYRHLERYQNFFKQNFFSKSGKPVSQRRKEKRGKHPSMWCKVPTELRHALQDSNGAEFCRARLMGTVSVALITYILFPVSLFDGIGPTSQGQ